MNLVQYKKTMFGIVILLILVIASLTYSQWAPADYGKDYFHYDQNGDIDGSAPFSPSWKHPFGTDISGNDLFLQMMNGAKYTILGAIFVSFFRVLLGAFFGVLLSLWLPKIIPVLKDFFLPFQYIPTLFITFALMVPVAPFTELPVMKVVIYQFLVMIFVAFPTMLFYTTDLIDEWKQSTFVQSSYLMGASHFHVLRKHYVPYLISYGTLMVVQQFFQTLVLMMHLGIFTFFIGGQSQSGLISGDPMTYLPSSLSNEWAGLIGQNFMQFMRAPWIVLSSIFGFFLLLAIANMMKKEIEESLSQSIFFHKKKKIVKNGSDKKMVIEADSFTIIEKES